MNKKIIVALAVFASATLSGCGNNNDFIGRTADENNRWLSIYSEKLESKEMAEKYEIYNSTDLQKLIKDSVSGTEFEQYFVDDDAGGCHVAFYEYINNKLEYLGYKTVLLPVKESNNISVTSKISDGYVYKKIEDVVCLEDKSGNIVGNYSLVLLSEHKDIMEKLDESGIGDFIRKRDKYIIDNMKGKWELSTDYAILSGYGGNVSYNGKELSYMKEGSYNQINSDTEYLIKYHADDAWMIVDSVSNDICDSVMYMIYECLNINTEINMRLYVYGRNNEIEEIKFVSDSADIPDYAKDTIINYIVAMGMDKDSAEFMVSNLPKDDGSSENVKYFAGTKNSKYYIKFSK